MAFVSQEPTRVFGVSARLLCMYPFRWNGNLGRANLTQGGWR